MDLRVIGATPSAAERRAVGAVADEVPPGPYSRRELLLPALLSVQYRVGFVSEAALAEICRRLGVPPAEAYGVASFYHLISLRGQPPAVAHVCTDVSCALAGADGLCRALEERLGPAGEPCAGGRATWKPSPCLGLCERAPAALVLHAGETPVEHAVGPLDPDSLLALLEERHAPPEAPVTLPQAGDPGLRLLRRVGGARPTSLEDYRASGGFEALERAFELGAAGVIREIAAARLLGRGGAAFPTSRKWEAVASQPVHPHYVVCNADESETGTFKDRVLLEEDPFALIEGLLIAALATGSTRGYVYIRGEYPLAAKRLAEAQEAARGAGLLGSNVLGRGLDFDFEIRRGGGAYICGEETALFNSIEGFRGEPRNKPPFPVTHGLFGKPTAINNVETLANVPLILREGAAAFAAVGTPDSTGTRLFCLSGAVAQPGVYEVALGTPLSRLIDLAGGVPGGRPPKAVLLGGAAGSFVAGDELEVPLSFEGTRRIGATLGSGAVIVLDEQADPWDVLSRIAAFFRGESCGQCVPCRVGTVRQEEALARLAAGKPLGSRAAEVALLREVGQAMRDASICGLGQTASSAIESALGRLGLDGGGA